MKFSKAFIWPVLLLATLSAFILVSDDADASVSVTYGSDSVGAERIVFDANGGSGGYAQYVLNGNQTVFPTEHKAPGDTYNHYTKISRDGYVLMGWSESRTATSPTFHPGQAYTVIGDRTFYAVWKDLTYDCIGRFGGIDDDIECEAQHAIVTKGGNPGLAINDDVGAYALMKASVSRGSLKYILTVSGNGNDISSQASRTNTIISADWLTVSISSSGEFAFSGSPSSVGVYRIHIEMQTKGLGGSYGDLEDLCCIWYVSVADSERDASVLMHVTYEGEDVGFGPRMTAVKLPDAVSQRQKGWNVSVDSSPAVFPVGGSYSVALRELVLTVNEYTFDEVMASGVVGVIAYNANGGSYNGAFAELVPTDNYAGLKSGSIVTKSGSTFLGWNASGSTADPIYPVGYLYDITGGYTELKAVWGPASASTFKVHMVNPGNGSQDSSFDAVSGYSYMLPNHGFELSKYTFKGWSTQRYEPGEGEPNVTGAVSPRTTTTYYAVFERTTYEFTIRYASGAGTGDMVIDTEESDTVPFYMLLRDSSFTPPDGYEFAGWSETKYAQAPSLLAGDYYTFFESGMVTLHAIYSETYTPPIGPSDPDDPDPEEPDQPVQQSYLFRLVYIGNGQGVTNVPAQENRILQITECSFYVPYSAPSRTDYRFMGWSDTPTGEASYEPGRKVTLSIPDGQTQTAKALYAVWEQREQDPGDGTKVTVTFQAESGTLRAVHVNSGSTVSSMSPPSKDGYAFIGWYNGSSKWDFSRPVVQDMTLTATYLKVFHLDIDGNKVRVMIDCNASSVHVEFSDGFEHTYYTTTISAHTVQAGSTGSVTVKATTDNGVHTAYCGYSVDGGNSDPEDEEKDDEKEEYAVYYVAGAVFALIVGGLLFWRFRL